MIWLLALLAIALGAALLDIMVLSRHGRWSPAWREPEYFVVPRHWLPGLLGSAAVTIGDRVLLRWGVTPSAYGLAHEYYHVLHTSWTRYVWSRLTGGVYHLQEESAANAFATRAHHGFEIDADSLAWYLHREVVSPRQVKP